MTNFEFDLHTGKPALSSALSSKIYDMLQN